MCFLMSCKIASFSKDLVASLTLVCAQVHFVCVPFQFRLVVKGFVANFTNTVFASFYVLFTVFVPGEGLSGCRTFHLIKHSSV